MQMFLLSIVIFHDYSFTFELQKCLDGRVSRSRLLILVFIQQELLIAKNIEGVA